METGHIIEKQYVYQKKNGKQCIIKRKYTTTQNRALKNRELDEYFTSNKEELKSRRKLKDILDEYNNNHARVSYAKFYLKFKNEFGYRKNHRRSTETENNDTATDTEHN